MDTNPPAVDSLGKLVGAVSHDFNNLLTVINGYSDMLVRDLEGDSREAAVEIRSAGERAVELARQLITFSREPVTDLKPLDLNRLIEHNLEVLARLVGADIQIVTCLAKPIEKISGDSRQMHQLLMNLAMNARDMMPRGGTLTIETSESESEFVALSIGDSRPELDVESVRKGHITGLALATAYGIVRQMGGTISFAMEPGYGAKIVIHLALAQPAAALDSRRVAFPAMGLHGIATILVVEDQGSVRKLTVRILERAGYRVLEAAEGGEAVRVAERHGDTIDLLLTDVVMPGVTGPELAKGLTAMRPLTKVLYMSGQESSIGLPGVGLRYIAKPFSPEALLRRVQEALEPPNGPRELL